MPARLPSSKKNLAPLPSRKAMLETLVQHLGMVRLTVGVVLVGVMMSCTG